ncbi:hypothetical protein ABEV41_00335 [Geobacillus thermodenitrificans]|uniref:hypothetical protein n=1 Tax=Geobacillus thermodenitrificans TaxID=33940 RepID=UPI003D22CDBB
MTPILTISAKNLQEGVNYIPFRLKDNYKENFTYHSLIKEVRKLNTKEKKQIQKTAKQFILTATAFLPLIIPTITSAAPIETIPINTNQEVPFPAEIINLVKWVITLAVGIGVCQALIMLVMSGMLRMIPNAKIEKIVKEWNSAILRGFLQVVIAAPLILLIWFVANKLLGSSGWFISPF